MYNNMFQNYYDQKNQSPPALGGGNVGRGFSGQMNTAHQPNPFMRGQQQPPRMGSFYNQMPNPFSQMQSMYSQNPFAAQQDQMRSMFGQYGNQQPPQMTAQNPFMNRGTTQDMMGRADSLRRHMSPQPVAEPVDQMVPSQMPNVPQEFQGGAQVNPFSRTMMQRY